jgi:hypothetical protein
VHCINRTMPGTRRAMASTEPNDRPFTVVAYARGEA